MKKYIYIIAISCLLFFTVGCQKYFDKQPLGKPVVGDFYGSLMELQLGVNAIYDVMAETSWQTNYLLFGSGPSDECNRVGRTASDPEGQIAQLAVNNSNPTLRTWWEQNYWGIFRANWVISNTDKVKIYERNSNAIIDLRDLLGQAKFLRAFYYFDLLKTFGGVPIKPEVLSITAAGDNFIQARSTKEEVYKYIEKDLREAVILLRPSVSDVRQRGKICRDAAISMLVRVLAYQAESGVKDPRWSEVLYFTSHLVDAKPIAIDKILPASLYTNESIEEVQKRLYFTDSTMVKAVNFEYTFELSPNYDLLWHVEGENSSEWIFYVNGVENEQSILKYGTQWSNAVGGGGIGADLIQPSDFMERLMNNSNDPRLVSSIGVQERYIYQGKGQNLERVGGTAPLPARTVNLKWRTLKAELASDGWSGKNFGLYRFAEVILWHAEALNETGNSSRAIDEINKLRIRANKIPAERVPVVISISPRQYGTYPEVRDAIWEERSIELCFEFERTYELNRIGRAKKQIGLRNRAIGDPTYVIDFIEGKSERFPIPQWEIDLTGGIVTQNPGY